MTRKQEPNQEALGVPKEYPLTGNESRQPHPAAEAWPMLSDDELDSLAADIKANGLQQPIVLDGDGLILDGRNRYEACLRAKVEPTFTTFDGDDPVSFVLSCNEHRRHMNKGQRAIAVARTCSLNEHSVRKGSKTAGVALGYVSQANQVIEFAPDLADQVAAGVMPLNDAYDQARQRKATAGKGEERIDILRREEPDLAEQVDAGTLKIGEAWAVAGERRQQRQRAAESGQYAYDNFNIRIGSEIIEILAGIQSGMRRPNDLDDVCAEAIQQIETMRKKADEA